MQKKDTVAVLQHISSLITMIILLFLLCTVLFTFIILIFINFEEFKTGIPIYFIAIIIICILFMIMVVSLSVPQIKKKIYFNFKNKYVIYKNNRYFFENLFYKHTYIRYKEVYLFYLKNGEEVFRLEVYSKVKKVIELFDLSL